MHKNAYFLHEKIFENSWGKLLADWDFFCTFVCFSRRKTVVD